MAMKRIIMNLIRRQAMKLIKQKGVPIVKRAFKRRLGKKF